MWGTENWSKGQRARPEFVHRSSEAGVKWQLTSTGDLEPVASLSAKYFGRLSATILVTIIFVGAVIVTVILSNYVKLLSRKNELGIYAEAAGAITSATSIIILGKIYQGVGTRLTEWETHRTQTAHENSHILKVISFEAVNNWAIILFITVLQHGQLFGRESECRAVTITCDADALPSDMRDQCVNGAMEVRSCMGNLQLHLLVFFVVKQWFYKIVEVGVPAVKTHSRVKVREMTMAKLIKDGTSENEYAREQVFAQSVLEEYAGVYLDYSELAIQFGYTTLFAVAFPLAPLLGLLSNVVELRVDALKLCRVHRRVQCASREDIGVWNQVFDTLAVSAVMTNAALICFIGSQMTDVLDTHTHSKLSRITDWRLWVAAVCIEHTVLLFRSVLQISLPSTPKWIGRARSLEEHEAETRLKSHTQLQLEKRSHENFLSSDHRTPKSRGERSPAQTLMGMGSNLSVGLKADLVHLFYEYDVDGDGFLSADEILGEEIEDSLKFFDYDEEGNMCLSQWLAGWEGLADELGARPGVFSF